jgi:hypothetical protein
MFSPNPPIFAELTELGLLQKFICLILDAKACAKRCEELTALTVQAIEAKAAAEQAEASLVAAKAEQEAVLAQQRQDNDTQSERLREREYALVISRDTVFAALGEMRTLDGQMKRALLNYAGMLDGFNERIQSLPSWESLHRDLLGSPDPHYGEHKSEHGRDGDFGSMTETERVPEASPEATITRSVPRRSMRRVQPDA